MLKTILKSKVSVKPTWRTWLSVLVISIALFASVNYQTSVLNWFVYSLLFSLAGVLTYTQFILADIQHDWSFNKHTFQSEPLDLKLNIKETVPYGIILEKNQYLDTNKKLPVGKHQLKQLMLYTEYPFGYFKAKIPLKDIGPLWVYPKPIEHQVDAQSSKSTGTSDLFRPYRPGDSPKRVLKKTMALPHDKWQSKRDASENQTTQEQELNWFVLGDALSASEKLEHLSFLIKHMSDNQLFSLVLPNKRISIGRGNAHKHHAWRALAETWNQLNLS